MAALVNAEGWLAEADLPSGLPGGAGGHVAGVMYFRSRH